MIKLFQIILRLGEALFAPAALAAVGANEVTPGKRVRCVDVLPNGRHDVLAALGALERAGVRIKHACYTNSDERDDKADADKQYSDPTLHLDKSSDEKDRE